jgi:NhaP-type Na+/H+ or K+/H+ antiporter
VSFGVARTLKSGNADVLAIIFEPLIEIVLSLGLGTVMGIILTHIEKMFNSNSNRLSLVIGFTVLTVALSMIHFEVAGLHCGFSSLLVCMMMGTIFCNICPLSEDLMERAEKWTSPLYVLFFVVSGAELELSVFSDMTIVIYITIAESINRMSIETYSTPVCHDTTQGWNKTYGSNSKDTKEQSYIATRKAMS